MIDTQIRVNLGGKKERERLRLTLGEYKEEDRIWIEPEKEEKKEGRIYSSLPGGSIHIVSMHFLRPSRPPLSLHPLGEGGGLRKSPTGPKVLASS